MTVDHIRYDLLAQEALRGMIRTLLTETAKKGLPGEHHFFVSFDTRAPGVRLSTRLREQYPEEMTIVLQHQFWDLKVTEERFEVGLSFNGVPEKLSVPFAALKGFVDPSVQFALQFEQITEPESEAAAPPAKIKSEKAPDKTSAKPRKPSRHTPTRTVPSIPAAPAPPLAVPEPALNSPPPDEKSEKPARGGEVVRLDRFRKKK